MNEKKINNLTNFQVISLILYFFFRKLLVEIERDKENGNGDENEKKEKCRRYISSGFPKNCCPQNLQ